MVARLSEWMGRANVIKVVPKTPHAPPFRLGTAVPSNSELAAITAEETAMGYGAAATALSHSQRSKLRKVFISDLGVALSETLPYELLPPAISKNQFKQVSENQDTTWGYPSFVKVKDIFASPAINNPYSYVGQPMYEVYNGLLDGFGRRKLVDVINAAGVLNTTLAAQWFAFLFGCDFSAATWRTLATSYAERPGAVCQNLDAAAEVGKLQVAVRIYDPTGAGSGAQTAWIIASLPRPERWSGVLWMVAGSVWAADLNPTWDNSSMLNGLKPVLMAVKAAPHWLDKIKEEFPRTSVAASTANIPTGSYMSMTAEFSSGWSPVPGHPDVNLARYYVVRPPVWFVEWADTYTGTLSLPLNANRVSVYGSVAVREFSLCAIGTPEFMDECAYIGATSVNNLGEIEVADCRVVLKWRGTVLAASSRDTTGVSPEDIAKMEALRVTTCILPSTLSIPSAETLLTTLTAYELAVEGGPEAVAQLRAQELIPAEGAQPALSFEQTARKVQGLNAAVYHQATSVTPPVLICDTIWVSGTNAANLVIKCFKNKIEPVLDMTEDQIIEHLMNPGVDVVNLTGLTDAQMIALAYPSYEMVTPAQVEKISRIRTEMNEATAFGENYPDLLAAPIPVRHAMMLQQYAHNKRVFSSVVLTSLVACRYVNKRLF